MKRRSPNSRSSSDVAVLHGTESPVLTVKQVAERLGVSTSTVYRINRVNGPFQFLAAGRRVLIDASSFDVYLAARRTQPLAKRVVAVTAGSPPVPRASTDARKGTGQRELNIPWRDPSLIIFLW